MHHGRRTTPSEKRRGLPFGLVGLAVIATAGLASIGTAGALLQPFTLSAASGPRGTVVHVRGTSCDPGPLVSGAQDYVRVDSTTFPLATTIPVAKDGSWSGQFTVPSNAPVLPGAVTAECFTDGLPSTTTYSPQTFSVTGAPTPAPTHPPVTTPAPTPGTGSGTTPGHAVTAPGGSGSGSGSGTPGAGNGSGSGSGSGAGTASGDSGRAGTPPPAAVGSGLAGTAGSAQTLTAAASGHHHLWLWWLLLLALVLAIGAFLLHRHYRQPEPQPVSTDS